MTRTRLLTSFAVVASAMLADSALASFHFMQIEQVIGGVNGDTNAQAIQLRLRSAGQNLVSQSRVIVRDAAGLNPITIVDMTTNVASGAGGARVLIASAGFLAQTTPPTVADFTMTSLIPPSYLAAGSLTFEDDFGTVYWRLSWGGAGYTGPGTVNIANDANGNANPPFAGALPSSGLTALNFPGLASAPSTTNAADFSVTAGAATFRNNAGATAFVVTGPPTGACCDLSTATCMDGVMQSACMGAQQQFSMGMTCAQAACPTMSEWGLIGLGLLTAGAGARLIRRRLVTN